jgi:hypothetical protein
MFQPMLWSLKGAGARDIVSKIPAKTLVQTYVTNSAYPSLKSKQLHLLVGPVQMLFEESVCNGERIR